MNTEMIARATTIIPAATLCGFFAVLCLAVAQAPCPAEKEKPFFMELKKYLKGELHGEDYLRVLALIYRGENAISKVRELAGSTNPEEASPTSIRGAYGRITTMGVYENVIHTSASPKEAEREIKLWFRPEEIVDNLYPVIQKEGSAAEWKTTYDQIDLG